MAKKAPNARVRELVLVHLSLLSLAACKGGADTATDAPTTPAVTGMASAAPHASLSPRTVPDNSPPAGTQGAVCLTARDCNAGLECMPDETEGARPGSATCGVRRGYMIRGRPLVVDGAPRVASWVDDDGDVSAPGLEALGEAERARLADRLSRAALDEHASVAAFARTVCELMSLGAPLWLLDETGRALSDEVRHARDSITWARALGAGARAPGPLPEAAAPFFGARGARELARELVRHGCVGETLAARDALEDADTVAHVPALHAFYTRIGEDEGRHAALAFSTVRWLAETDAEIARAVTEEAAACLDAASADERMLLRPLFEHAGIGISALVA